MLGVWALSPMIHGLSCMEWCFPLFHPVCSWCCSLFSCPGDESYRAFVPPANLPASSQKHHLGAAYKACFLRLALLSCREGSLWNLLVAREWMVPICYFDFLAECVSSYQVRNCRCEVLMSMLGAPVSRSGCLVSIGAYVCMGR